MTYDLTDRTAVVTGASSGIGAETARTLARAGARVALLARRAERVAELADEITAEGGQAVAVAADVTDDLAVAVDRVHDAFGRVDLVVANAGVMLPNPIADGRVDQWRRMLDTNVLGLLATVRAFTDDLVAAGAEGRRSDLVTVSSIGSYLVLPDYAVYCATKAAVTHLAANLRTEFGPRGVRVTNVEPGLVETELGDHMDNPRIKADLAAWREAAPPLSPVAIADVIAYTTSRCREFNVRQVVVLPTAQV
ncbi:SDR family oxidoreductase [Saccharothrix violaceirubra]|uniref:NADP-dependent 3-hydroxy acid dehydrogenase YdfG n=1 Tax=Saccharothrix violaceirubra TaxID=413306 RepID=A0A7W7T7Y9_9PSEU|nr:SDR family oxidoreductase [Saccharothrix violaceirubra]MBB4968249.1 NADP-dependent 3-hydroxy acid dehydrogenase YdfG [Saccharothrix violaceirubra]